MDEPTATVFYRHEHGEHPVHVASASAMDELVDTLAAGDWQHSLAAVYHDQRPKTPRWGKPDHELYLAVNPDTKTGALRLMGVDEAGNLGTWFTKGDTHKSGEVHYFYMQSDREFPADSEIPLEQVHQAAREFLTNGGHRPICVAWQPVSPF